MTELSGKVKAIGLLSGGLDSTLAVRVMIDQGIDVIAVKFTSPFCQCDSGGCCHAAEAARKMGVPLKVFAKGDDYLEVVQHPRHGYGSGVNPCIDCRIFMLSRTREYMDEIGAAFVFTGEVLGQRPMSQHRRALDLIERESGMAGRILRPLSARHLDPTEAELKGWVNREHLLSIEGRSRKPQIALAEEYGIRDYPCPAGGCLLTDARFAARLRDLFAHQERVGMADVRLLKVGRHFRAGDCKIVCGRDQKENEFLQRVMGAGDRLFEVSGAVGPTVLLRGEANDEAVRLAAAIAAAYSDASASEVVVRSRGAGADHETRLAKPDRSAVQPHAV